MKITVKHLPNIFNNTGRKVVEIEYSRRTTLREYVQRAGFPIEDHRIIVTNKENPDLDKPVQPGDEIIVTPQIGDPISATIAIFSAVGAWAAANVVAATLLAITIGYSIYQATQKPKMPNFGGLATGSFEDSSPTYGWDGIRTLQGEVNVPIPIGYGRHRVGGNIINQFVRTDGEKQYLYLLLALAEGPVSSIGNIQINDNPIENFADVQVVTRLGTNDQEPIPNFEELHQVNEVSVNVLKATP